MNVEVEKIFSFGAVFDDPNNTPWINTYEVRLHMTVATEHVAEYNMAYERLKHWFEQVMQDCVLVSSTSQRSTAWKDTGLRLLDFPVVPVDQVIGLMLMRKLTAITEGRIMITRVSITSPADDFVTYHCDLGDDLHWFEDSGWWSDPRPVHSSSHNRSRNNGKVISISRSQDWKDHDLDWPAAGDVGGNGNVSLLPGTDRDA